ncbi:baseplate tail-tube junction protein [Aeromonas hydrophila]|uniref:baseplate tail-tube junction protein n=1 Tax=Aeromonas hydrophila TaxID=644 RepID=UPI00208E8D23|nr:baseplate tail-tube junction protein [Aeromonas hydrophila]MCO4201228.1 baseplate tail-tube junction protein [Aeromonas hydrophila]
MASTSIISSSASKMEPAQDKPEKVKFLTYPASINDLDPTTGKHVHSSSLIFHITKAMDGGNLTGKSLKARQDTFLKSPQSTSTIGMIQLHMPAMAENVSHNYADGDTTILNDMVESYRIGKNTAGSGWDKVGAGFGAMAERGMDRLSQDLTGGGSVAKETGKIQKQRNSLLYQGTALRTQTFSYVLRPRSVAELKHVGEIIHAFRLFSAGTRGKLNAVQEVLGDYESFGTVSAPPIWFVEERINDTTRPRHIDKFMFGPAAVTAVNVNKTPEQLYQTIAGTGGDPVEVVLEVTMQEMIPAYSDFWAKGRSGMKGI